MATTEMSNGESAVALGHLRCARSPLLASMCIQFRTQILVPADFPQLAGEFFGRFEPDAQAILELVRGGCIKRLEKGLDCQVVTHGVPLDDSKHPADVHRLAIGISARDCKSDFAAARGAEIRLQRETRCQPEGIGV